MDAGKLAGSRYGLKLNAALHILKAVDRKFVRGYQQRVELHRAIVHNPRFVVLDEPTNGLDPVQIVEVRHLIKEIAAERAVMLLPISCRKYRPPVIRSK